MRAVWCEPGSAIVAGPSLPVAPDLFLGWAFQVKRRWGRTVVIDEDDREWHGGVWVLPPWSFRRCTAVRGLVQYPAVLLLGGASQPPRSPGSGLVWPPGNPGRAARKSTAANEKDALSVNRTRPLPVRARTVESAGTGH